MQLHKEKKVCIIGVGYVGEHLLNTFGEKYEVVGVDISEKRIDMLRKKYNKANIKFQSNFKNLEHCDVYLVSVPTLVKEDLDIDLGCLHAAKDTLLKIARPGSLIVVESSVYVGATREIFGEFLTKNIFVGFSPERVDPGRIDPPMKEIPKVISGLTKESLEKIQTVYGKVIKNLVPVSSCECAEMCKLYENCFRMVNIAYVNEISDMCENLNIDSKEMINAASTKPFGFMPFYPGLGVGGHCIPVNPYYLFKNGNLPVLKYATDIMKYRPKTKAKEIMLKKERQVKDCILLCGIGFKKNESLLTNSCGYEMLKEFEKKGYNIIVYDPIVEKEYNKNDINFLNKSLFTSLNFLKTKFELIIVNHCSTNKEVEIIKNSGVETIYF